MFECKGCPFFGRGDEFNCLFFFVESEDVEFGEASVVSASGGGGCVGACFVGAGDSATFIGGGF